LEVRIAELTALDEEQKKYINAELAERLAKAEKDAKDWESCARYQRGADEKILTKKLAPLTDPNRDRLFVALQALHMLEPTVSNLSKVVATAIMPGNKPVNKPDDETPPE
jgi:hypothetical protein